MELSKYWFQLFTFQIISKVDNLKISILYKLLFRIKVELRLDNSRVFKTKKRLVQLIDRLTIKSLQVRIKTLISIN